MDTTNMPPRWGLKKKEICCSLQTHHRAATNVLERQSREMFVEKKYILLFPEPRSGGMFVETQIQSHVLLSSNGVA
jgi:hypothetical protein